MSGRRGSRSHGSGSRGSGARRYPRTARLNELFREILGDEVERVDDDRLAMVTIMSVDVQTDLERATVFWSSVLADEEADDAIQEAFAEARPRLQKAIGRQARVRRVPELVFRPDASVRSAERIEGILREIHDDNPPAGSDQPDHDGPDDRPVVGPDDAVSHEPLRDGFAVIDKPSAWTSHDVVAKVRGILRNKKIGHSGTLDPDATGVLLLGVGRVTRLLRYLTALPKTYTGEMVLGIETSTLDAGGEVTATHEMSGVTAADVQAAARQFVGDIEQIPPMVSAVRIGGERLHELARRGETVDRDPRPVTVHRLDVAVVDAGLGVYRLDVECSSGTFIRTLAADIGAALGGGAHLRSLRRTAIGSFTVDEATTIEGVAVRPPAEALRDYPAVEVTADVAIDVSFGKVLPLDRLGVVGDGPWPVLGPAGELIAVYEPHKGEAKPSVVLAPAG